jgi:hypothetical protein
MTFLDRLDSIAKKIERFVAGSGPSDPLYLTNRTLGQKIRLGLLIGAPVLALGALVVMALGNYFDMTPAVVEQRIPRTSAPAVTAKLLPNLEKTYRSESDQTCDVLEASVGAGDHVLSGKLRNNTDQAIHVADVVFDVTDEEGSQLGAVAVKVEDIAPHAVASFRMTLPQEKAKNALVRELHTR